VQSGKKQLSASAPDLNTPPKLTKSATGDDKTLLPSTPNAMDSQKGMSTQAYIAGAGVAGAAAGVAGTIFIGDIADTAKMMARDHSEAEPKSVITSVVPVDVEAPIQDFGTDSRVPSDQNALIIPALPGSDTADDIVFDLSA
jgi:hypothetical protein